MILIAITLASFSVWQIPDNPKMTIVVTDYESHLNGIDARHEIIRNAVDESLLKMIDGDITEEEFISIAEISSLQIKSQISELVESKAPEEWQKSYLNYLESLRSSNPYIREVIVLSNLQIDGSTNDEITNILQKIEKFQKESREFAKLSDQFKP